MEGTVTGTRRYSSDLEQGGMEIPCKLTFMGPPTELQKVQKFFVSALGVRVIFSCPMITGASVSSSLGSVTTTSSESPPSKHTLDTWAKNRECSQAKRVKCDDSASESSSIATRFSKPSPTTLKVMLPINL